MAEKHWRLDGPDRRGVGFYFRNVTELVLLGIRGKNNRTLKPGRTMPNIIGTRERRHSQKPDEMWDVIERCSPGPRLELFARHYQNRRRSYPTAVMKEEGPMNYRRGAGRLRAGRHADDP